MQFDHLERLRDHTQRLEPFRDIHRTVLEDLPLPLDMRRYILSLGYNKLYQLGALMMAGTVVDNIQQSLLNLALRLPKLPPSVIVDLYHMGMSDIDLLSLPGIYESYVGGDPDIRSARITKLKNNIMKVQRLEERHGALEVEKHLGLRFTGLISDYFPRPV